MKKLRLQSGDATRMSKALLRFYLFPLLFQMVIYSPFDHFLVITCHSNAAIWYFHSNSLLFFSFILYPFEWIVVDFLFSFTSLTYYSFLKHSCFCKVKFWLQFSSISKNDEFGKPEKTFLWVLENNQAVQNWSNSFFYAKNFNDKPDSIWFLSNSLKSLHSHAAFWYLWSC